MKKIINDYTNYTVPFSFDTDDVMNLELGWKLDLLDGNLRFNGDIFYIDVDNMQVGIFDTDIANLFFSDNAANAAPANLSHTPSLTATAGSGARETGS